MTIKEIKRTVARGLAEDITTASKERLDESGKLYAITSRSTNLFKVI